MEYERSKSIRDELKVVGVGALGLKTAEVSQLAKILHPNEKLGGVIYGRYDDGIAWLVATDLRIIFIDKKPLFMTTDELTYDVVSGIKSSHGGLATSVTLHTRVNDYTMRYVNAKCARIFVKYIETRRLESGTYDTGSGRYTTKSSQSPNNDFNPQSLQYIKSHDLAVLSTVDRTGNVFGAVVYYSVDLNNNLYIITKSETTKSRNIFAQSQVAVTIHETGSLQTLQLQGIAEIETDIQIKERVFNALIKPRNYNNGKQLPPVANINGGAYMVIKIIPLSVKFNDYTVEK